MLDAEVLKEHLICTSYEHIVRLHHVKTERETTKVPHIKTFIL